MKYEAHITSKVGYRPQLELYGRAMDWSYSQIWNDPKLGAEAFAYLTKHSDDALSLKNEMEQAAKYLGNIGIPILRLKIEQIVYDSKE
jgi:hypothetical protein